MSPRLTCEIVKSCSARPILLVDVDGVVSLFGFATAPPAGLIATSLVGLPDFLSPQAGSRLNRLAATFRCACATGWEQPAEARPHGPPRQGKLGATESWAGPETPPGEDDVTRLESWARRS